MTQFQAVLPYSMTTLILENSFTLFQFPLWKNLEIAFFHDVSKSYLGETQLKTTPKQRREEVDSQSWRYIYLTFFNDLLTREDALNSEMI